VWTTSQQPVQMEVAYASVSAALVLPASPVLAWWAGAAAPSPLVGLLAALSAVQGTGAPLIVLISMTCRLRQA
jgi:glucose-6-phosphate dehydrogenase assembly protein OpcA